MDICNYDGVDTLTPRQIKDMQRSAAQDMARRGLPSLFAYAMAMLVLSIGSPYGRDHPWVIYGASALFALTLSIRMLLLVKFDALYDSSPRQWDWARQWSLILTSAVWGIVSSLALYFYHNGWPPLFATAATAAICSGGIISLGMDKVTARAHMFAILIPNTLVSLLIDSYGMAVFFLTYLGFCLFQIRYVNQEYWSARINAVRLDNDTQQRLHSLTYHDSLTNLPNRELFLDRLQQAVLDARRRQVTTAVIFIGLDRFKQVNDTLGHHAGDDLLKDVAARISPNLRENDTLARYAGHTFAMILTDFKDPRDAGRVASKLLKNFNQPFEIQSLELFVTASIGITLFPSDADNADTLIKNAEATMSRVKKQGGNDYQYFEESINAESLERLQLETRLRRALERDEFILHYQPKVDLNTGKLSGFEALIRWCPEDKEMVPPFKFIPILEDTGLIVQVGEWVLKTACSQARCWHQKFGKPIRIAVNLSARQLTNGCLVDTVKRTLSETGLEAKYLELEITESMLIHDTDRIMQILNELNKMGVHLSIDDFGTGYSSLSYLKRMPIHSLKIDRSFVKDITTDINDAAVVETIIAMAHTMNLNVVAEGTETMEQVQFLKDRHCDETQGYYFSKPLPISEIHRMFEIGDTMLTEDNLISFESKLTRIKQPPVH